MTTPNTPEENAAQMRRAAGKQPDALRTHGGYHMGPTFKSPAGKPVNTQAPRTIR